VKGEKRPAGVFAMIETCYAKMIDGGKNVAQTFCVFELCLISELITILVTSVEGAAAAVLAQVC
jgi:hypothetical protein